MYNAIVCRVKTRPHPNADKLQLATANGYQVVISKDVPDGTLGVFFGADGQISEEFAAANDLVGYSDPVTGEKRGGFFPKSRRVRAQKFRGEKSDGYWTSLDSFVFTGADVSNLAEGTQFAELNGVPICNKYYTPATLKAMKKGTSQSRHNRLFAKHVDTKQFKHNLHTIPTGSLITFTEKLHGTSGRFGYVLDEKKVKKPWRKRVFRKKKFDKVEEYDHLIGTRNVILGKHEGPSFYGSEEFRYNAVERLHGQLHKGEQLYFELVGYQTTGAPIMSRQHTEDLKDIKKQYGPVITYSYGEAEGNCGLYVYRITQVSEDGNIVELSWAQVKRRCRELGINHVPEIGGLNPWLLNGPGALDIWVDGLMEGPSLLDANHIREGVVIRVDRPDGETEFLKSKSFSFGVMEGYLKNSEDYVDLEEAS